MTRLDVITGFLGAGKTTFVARYSHWLQNKGISFCIIENEFGRAGVDGAALSRSGYRVKEISGGCVCCTLKVTLHDLLMELSQEVERIILEPSGLFCGDDLLDILHTDAVRDRVQLGMWTGILDPLCVPVLEAGDLSVLQSELWAAGSLILSKTQLSSQEDVRAAYALATSLFQEGAPVLWAEPWDAYRDDEWFPALWEQGALERPHPRVLFDHATMFQSATLSPAACWTEKALRQSLALLLDGRAGVVLRVKGSLKAQEGGTWHVNCTPGCVLLNREEQLQPPMLNLIGRGLARQVIRELLEGESHD